MSTKTIKMKLRAKSSQETDTTPEGTRTVALGFAEENPPTNGAVATQIPQASSLTLSLTAAEAEAYVIGVVYDITVAAVEG